MAYLGNVPADSFTSFAKQDFTTSATTSYTLDYPVANANEIALFINFVRQEPTTAYSASGTSLTLTSATSATDDMYCVFLGKALQTVNPPAGSVGLSQLSATGTPSSSTFLRGDNSWVAAGGTNTPAFSVSLATGYTASASSYNLVTYETVEFDTESQFNTTNNYYKITETGKYLVQIQVRHSHSLNGQEYFGIALYKDTASNFASETEIAFQRLLTAYATHTYHPEYNHQLNDIISFTSGDYLRVKAYNGSGNTKDIVGNNSGQPRSTTWSMMKLID